MRDLPTICASTWKHTSVCKHAQHIIHAGRHVWTHTLIAVRDRGMQLISSPNPMWCVSLADRSSQYIDVIGAWLMKSDSRRGIMALYHKLSCCQDANNAVFLVEARLHWGQTRTNTMPGKPCKCLPCILRCTCFTFWPQIAYMLCSVQANSSTHECILIQAWINKGGKFGACMQGICPHAYLLCMYMLSSQCTYSVQCKKGGARATQWTLCTN